MKQIGLFGFIICIAFLVGCESTETAGRGNQEQKRRAAIERQKEGPQPSEGERNLWNAQRDVLVRDSNPAIRY